MSQPTPTRGLGPDTRRDLAARRLVTARLADVRAYEQALAGSADVDAVHDMRVAARRLRAALQVFGRGAALGGRERSVKRLQDALGQVRDLHVQLAWLDAAARGQRGAGRVALRGLRAQAARSLGACEAQLGRELRRWRERSVPSLLRDLEALRDGGRYAGPRSLRHLQRSLARVRRRLRTYDAAPDALSAHRLRIAVKRLRYEAEVLRPGLRRRMTALLEVLQPLQEVLGELHDADVRLEQLGALATRGEAPVRAAARRLLERAQQERRERASEAGREVQRWRIEHLPRVLRRLLVS